jgi:hypothetical protein
MDGLSLGRSLLSSQLGIAFCLRHVHFFFSLRAKRLNTHTHALFQPMNLVQTYYLVLSRAALKSGAKKAALSFHAHRIWHSSRDKEA